MSSIDDSTTTSSSSSMVAPMTAMFHQLPEPYNQILSLSEALEKWNRIKEIPHDNVLALVRSQLVHQIQQLENSFLHEIRCNAQTLQHLIEKQNNPQQSPSSSPTSTPPQQPTTIAKAQEIDAQLRRLYTILKDKRSDIERIILSAVRQPTSVPPSTLPPTQPPSGEYKNPHHYYTKVRTLRQTLFGKLKVFQRHSDGLLVAIKLSSKQLVLERKTHSGTSVSENPQYEIEVLRLLNAGGSHPHILQLYEELEDEYYYWTVLELANKGEFFDIIKRERFSEPKARHYFLQMIRGASHMHSLGLCHLDLSLENLLMNDKDELKICDFGLTRRLIHASDHDIIQRQQQQQHLITQLTHLQTTYQQQHHTWDTHQQQQARTQIHNLSYTIHALTVNAHREIKFPGEHQNKPGKLAYMAPEIFASRDFDGRACDIWSMGIILFMSITGVPPFNHPAVSDQRFRLVYTGQLERLLQAWDLLHIVSPLARDLISQMLSPAERRITMEGILQHPWITLQPPSQHPPNQGQNPYPPPT